MNKAQILLSTIAGQSGIDESILLENPDFVELMQQIFNADNAIEQLTKFVNTNF